MHLDQSAQIEKALAAFSPQAQIHTRSLMTTLENMNATIAPAMVSLLAASYDAGAGNIGRIEIQKPTEPSLRAGNVINFSAAAARIRQRRAMVPTA